MSKKRRQNKNFQRFPPNRQTRIWREKQRTRAPEPDKVHNFRRTHGVHLESSSRPVQHVAPGPDLCWDTRFNGMKPCNCTSTPSASVSKCCNLLEFVERGLCCALCDMAGTSRFPRSRCFRSAAESSTRWPHHESQVFNARACTTQQLRCKHARTQCGRSHIQSYRAGSPTDKTQCREKCSVTGSLALVTPEDTKRHPSKCSCIWFLPRDTHWPHSRSCVCDCHRIPLDYKMQTVRFQRFSATVHGVQCRQNAWAGNERQTSTCTVRVVSLFNCSLFVQGAPHRTLTSWRQAPVLRRVFLVQAVCTWDDEVCVIVPCCIQTPPRDLGE